MNTLERASTVVEVCMLSHGNWVETEEAALSALKFGLNVHVGVTIDGAPPFSHENIQFYSVPWSDHFADARNGLLAKINSDCQYFFWIDSDEIVFSFPKIKRDDLTDLVYGIWISSVTGWTPGVRCSLHRNDAAIKYSGSIHERLVVSGDKPERPVSVLSGAMIIHTGYDDPDATSGKLQRNTLIAERAVDDDPNKFGAVVSIARYNTDLGRGTAIDWIKVYKAAEIDRLEYPYVVDKRWEAAAALAQCGILRPAETLIETNQLNIALQMSLLIGSFALFGKCSSARLEFVSTCLRNYLWDELYSFESDPIGFTVEELRDYVRRKAMTLQSFRTCHVNDEEHQPMNPDTVFVRDQDVLLELFQEEVILLSRRTNRVLSLNKTAQVLWDALEWGLSPSESCQMMQEALGADIDTSAKKEIADLFLSLHENGFISEAGR